MLLGGQTIALAVGAIASIVLARTLKPAGFGTYSALSVAVSLASLVAVFGLDTHLITELSAQPHDRRSYGGVFRVSLELTLAMCSLAVVFVLLTTRGALRIAALLAVIEVALTPFLLGRSVLLAKMRQGWVAVVGTANRLALLASVALIALLHASPPLVWMVGASLLAVVVEIFCLRPLVGPPTGVWRRLGHRRRRLVAATWPLAAAGVAVVAYNRLDQLLLTAFRGRAQVGEYAAAVNLATVLGVISAVVYTATLPAIIEVCRHGQEAEARRAVNDMGLLICVPGGLGIAVFAGAGGLIAQLLFGPAYSHEHGLVAVLAFAELWVFAGTSVMAILVAIDRRRVLFAATGIALAINVVLNLIFLHSFGPMAAAWASLISYCVAACVPAFLVSDVRRIGTPLLGVVLKTAIAAAVGALVGATFSTIVPAVGMSSLVYFIGIGALLGRSLARLAHQMLYERRQVRA
jgi:O-antigen/teichoic acid export membrane protein